MLVDFARRPLKGQVGIMGLRVNFLKTCAHSCVVSIILITLTSGCDFFKNRYTYDQAEQDGDPQGVSPVVLEPKEPKIEIQSKSISILSGNLALSEDHGCAKIGEQAICWGKNNYAQLSEFSWIHPETGKVNHSRKVKLTRRKSYAPGYVGFPDKKIKSIYAGPKYTCSIVRQEGSDKDELNCWGSWFNFLAITEDNFNCHYKKLTDPSVDYKYWHRSNTTKVEWNVLTSLESGVDPNSGSTIARRNKRLGFTKKCNINIPSTPIGFEEVTDIHKLALGVTHVCAIVDGGKVKCFGFANGGNLANGVDPFPWVIKQQKKIDEEECAEDDFKCQLENNSKGGLGYFSDDDDENKNNTSNDRNKDPNYKGPKRDWLQAPQYVVTEDGSVLEGIRELKTGGGSTCALSIDGLLYCWGAFWGVSNNVLKRYDDVFPHASLVEDIFDEPNNRITDFDMNGKTLCVIFKVSTTKCISILDEDSQEYFGNQDSSQSRILSSIDIFSSAKKIYVIKNKDGTPILDIQNISLGKKHFCFIKNNKIFCQGRGSFGQLGDGTLQSRTWPEPVTQITQDIHKVLALTTKGNNSCALLYTLNANLNVEILCWGDNRQGQLGLADLEPEILEFNWDLKFGSKNYWYSKWRIKNDYHDPNKKLSVAREKYKERIVDIDYCKNFIKIVQTACGGRKWECADKYMHRMKLNIECAEGLSSDPKWHQNTVNKDLIRFPFFVRHPKSFWIFSLDNNKKNMTLFNWGGLPYTVNNRFGLHLRDIEKHNQGGSIPCSIEDGFSRCGNANWSVFPDPNNISKDWETTNLIDLEKKAGDNCSYLEYLPDELREQYKNQCSNDEVKAQWFK